MDLDPQGHLAIGLGHNPNTLHLTVANLLYSTINGISIQDKDMLLPISENLDLLPSNRKLMGVSERLAFAQNRDWLDSEGPRSEECLRQVLEPYREQYDYILIDCQPNVSILTRNALVAADSVLLPIEAHYLAFEGLSETMDIIAMIREHFNPGLQVKGILFTKYQSRTNLCKRIREDVEDAYTDRVRIFSEPIAFSIRAAEQSAAGLSIFDYDKKSSVASSYLALAKEVMGCV